MAWVLVNVHRENEVLPSLTIAAVTGCVKSLKPKFEKIGYRKQGSKDENSAMCKARFLWCLQLGLRFGIITKNEARNILIKKGKWMTLMKFQTSMIRKNYHN